MSSQRGKISEIRYRNSESFAFFQRFFKSSIPKIKHIQKAPELQDFFRDWRNQKKFYSKELAVLKSLNLSNNLSFHKRKEMGNYFGKCLKILIF